MVINPLLEGPGAIGWTIDPQWAQPLVLGKWANDCLVLGIQHCSGPLSGYSVVLWEISPPSNIRRLLQVPKVKVLISKVGPPSVRNNPKGPHPHKKC